jgi:hypothetical protein
LRQRFFPQVFLKFFEQPNIGKLKKYESDKLVTVKHKIDKAINEIKDFELPNLELPVPTLKRRNYSYMLLPDKENKSSSDKLEERFKRPHENLVKSFNDNFKDIGLSNWPINYVHGKPPKESE